MEPEVSNSLYNELIHIFSIQVVLAYYFISFNRVGVLHYKTFIMLLILCLRFIKLVTQRNHLLNYLILIEFYIILIYCVLLSKLNILTGSSSSVFLFMVIMVCGACIGISLLVKLTRKIRKELEMSNLTY